MKTFNQKTKNKYIARVKAHAEADEIVKGTYWEYGKGCAVGCTIHSSDHDSYEKELGIPSLVIPRIVIWQFENKKYGLKNIKEVRKEKEVYGFCEEVVALLIALKNQLLKELRKCTK